MLERVVKGQVSQLMSSARNFNYPVSFLCSYTVVCFQERVKMNKILSNALEWGVKILYIDGML